MTNSQIVVVGSLNSDLVAFLTRFPEPGETVRGRDFKTYSGGKGANQAYAAGKLGACVSMIGQVGRDAAGDAQLANLEAAGVDTSLVLRDHSAPTGTALIAIDDTGQNRIIVIPGANGTFTTTLLDPCRAAIENADFVLLQLEIPMETVRAAVNLAKSGRARVILDPAPAAALVPELLQKIDYLTPNLSELGALTGRKISPDALPEEIIHAARSLCARGVGTVIAKLGERGAMRVTAETSALWPAFPVKAVDTTAAGDCFNGAFAAVLASGQDECAAGRFACAAAAISVSRAGAQPSMPSRAEVEAMLANQKNVRAEKL